MYTIAFCDDDLKELAYVKNCLEQYQKVRTSVTYQTDCFANAQALLEKIRSENYMPDILLLDIFMPGKNGIEAAEEIRRLGCAKPIIFLTASTEHALYAFGVDAVQYLVKPLQQEKFFHAMDTAANVLHSAKESRIVLKAARGVRQVHPREIIYCESQKNYQVLYLKSEELRVRMTAGQLWEMLEKFPQFDRCGRSYILNMDHIVSVKQDEILLDDGSTVYIPRNKAADFKKRYFSYYFD